MTDNNEKSKLGEMKDYIVDKSIKAKDYVVDAFTPSNNTKVKIDDSKDKVSDKIVTSDSDKVKHKVGAMGEDISDAIRPSK